MDLVRGQAYCAGRSGRCTLHRPQLHQMGANPLVHSATGSPRNCYSSLVNGPSMALITYTVAMNDSLLQDEADEPVMVCLRSLAVSPHMGS